MNPKNFNQTPAHGNVREFNWKYLLATSKECWDTNKVHVSKSKRWLVKCSYAEKWAMTTTQSSL